MVSYSRWKPGPWPLALVVLALVACGGGSSAPDDSGTSALSFQIQWERPGYQPASVTDCLDVATVSAAVYSDAGELLGAGGPWACETGSGTISDLPANTYASVHVAGYGPLGEPLYYGQGATIFLTPGSVDGGVITAGPFVPTLVSPGQDARVNPESVVLEWNPLPGAAGYVVTLAFADTFAQETIFGEYTITDPATTHLQPDPAGWPLDQPTVYWRVAARSAAGLTGTPSATRQFNLEQVLVSSVTFVGDDPVTAPPQTQTTVAFSYSSIVFTQEQVNVGVVAQWSAPMDSADYFALQDVIIFNELMAQGDITYSPFPCAGWSGLAVSMIYNSAPYGFTIYPVACDQTYWTMGVIDLVALKDDLVAKYAP